MGDSTAVRLRGIPYSASTIDVEYWLTEKGVHVARDGVRMETKEGGRPTGQAFVTLESSDQLQRALALSGEDMGERYIEIFEWSADKEKPRSGRAGPVVRLRGIPFSSTAIEVELWLLDKGVRVARDGVRLEKRDDGRSSGQAFAELESFQELQRALSISGENMGERYIEVFECTPEENPTRSGTRDDRRDVRDTRGAVRDFRDREPPRRFERERDGVNRRGDFVVRLRGLPYSASEYEIAGFLRGVKIAPKGIHLVFNNEGRPSGLAYVEVMSGYDVDDCIARHGEHIGNRYIEVFRSSSEEMRTGGNARTSDNTAGSPICLGQGFVNRGRQDRDDRGRR